jgi:hypothetical protein
VDKIIRCDAILKAEGAAGYLRPRDTMLDLVESYADRLASEGVEVTPEAVSASSEGWYSPLDAKVALAWLKAEREISDSRRHHPRVTGR